MLRLQLLGERRLSLGSCDVSAAIRYRKGWALLGYLAVERGRRHPREQIAELLWPTLGPVQARTNLRQVLTDLNQACDRNGGEGLLETTRDSIGLFPQAHVSIDLITVEAVQALPLEADPDAVVAAEQHLDWLGGEFMAGFGLADCPDFEQWLEAARRRLATTTLETLTRLCLAQRAQGRIPQAIASARQLVQLDEWNEGHQRQLMQLLAAAGLHRQALEQYQSLAFSLRAELDAEPEPRTQALRTRIELESRRAAAASGSPAVERSLAAQVRRWLGERGGMPAGDDPGLPTQRTLPVTGAISGRHAGRGWLDVEHGDEPARRIPVTATPVLIGRSRESDLCIPHDTVSRQHCAVWHDRDEGFRIRDLGSTNGTRVNDAVVEEAALRNGDCILLGGTVLRFGCGGERG